MEESLKLIAIKPLKYCNPHLLRVLNHDEVYYLAGGYKIEKFQSLQEKISASETLAEPFFDIGHIKVHLSAVVGKNGSGKSSLVELLYAALYNISHRLKLIEETDDDGERYLKEKDVNVDIYYQLNGIFYRIRCRGSELLLGEFNLSGEGFIVNEGIRSLDKLKKMFYSIVINYSLYSLNTEDHGHWLKAIFHKNDAYQTPIVLNPYRLKGNIDINSENYLVHSRLLSNILEGNDFALWFNNERKFPRRLVFTLDESKFEIKKGQQLREKLLNNYVDYWPALNSAILEVFFPEMSIKIGKERTEEFAKKYILLKLESISRKYKPYFRFKDFHLGGIAGMRSFLSRLKMDKSHISYKIKQAIHFLYFDILPKNKNTFARSVKGLVKRIAGKVDEGLAIPMIELVPPSFFKVDIEFHNKQNRFSFLSSGEKQKIYTISSLIYHLRNLNSVKENLHTTSYNERLVKYENINIIFDEVELYYHPELQRRFIKDLFDNIRAANLLQIKSINFLFVTHSPFILSDIPNENILYLQSKDFKNEQLRLATQTFGGNIHDLLANSFFLDENGYMGEYARQLISSAFFYLLPENKKPELEPELELQWNQNMVRVLIDIVGEPMVKRSLNELFADKFLLTVDEIDREISRLKSLKEKKV